MKVEQWREESASLVREHGNHQVSTVSISQVFGGMRGVSALLCDTSEVPMDKGLIIRGHYLKDLTEKTPVEVFYLLLTGDLPNEEEYKEFSYNLRVRKFVPFYVWEMLKSMPKDSHPMTMLSMAVLSMQRESIFANRYFEGASKHDYWKYVLEDAMNIVAKLPSIAASIYRLRFNKGELIQPDPNMDLTADFVHMLGLDDRNKEFYNFMRLFLVTHSDHEGGNVSAFTNTLVNSALSDPYYSVSAGLNGLAGPLHGLANQESIRWVLGVMAKYGGNPSRDQIREHVIETIASGRVVPGYGHAVLRVEDPRFTAFYNFAKQNCMEDPVVQTVDHLYNVVPDILKTIEKIKNPYPNVDAITGSLLYHYGIKEFSYYTVIFALSRAIGLASQAVVNRAIGSPLTRPKSVTSLQLKKALEEPHLVEKVEE